VAGHDEHRFGHSCREIDHQPPRVLDLLVSLDYRRTVLELTHPWCDAGNCRYNLGLAGK